MVPLDSGFPSIKTVPEIGSNGGGSEQPANWQISTNQVIQDNVVFMVLITNELNVYLFPERIHDCLVGIGRSSIFIRLTKVVVDHIES
jgi:hypothetical protein